jgi:nucleoside-diphosphate-sugar epimerase
MTALVTGASGFIGSHLVDALQAGGESVRALLRRSSRRDNLRESNPDFVFGTLDDVEALAAAVDGVDTVYHVAGITSGFNREDYDRANTMGVANLFEALGRSKQPARRVVYVSSLVAAGPSHPNVARREHHEVEEFTHYGRSKLAAERIAYEVARSGLTEVVIVRPPLVYGPRDVQVLQMIKAANRHLVGQAGIRAKWLSAVHVKDLVDGILLASAVGTPLPRESDNHVLAGGGEPYHHVPKDPIHPAGQGIYYFTDGGRTTEGGFGQTAARILGKRALTLPLPGPVVLGAGIVTQAFGRLRGKAPALNVDKARATLCTGWWCDDSKAIAEVGYAPTYSLERGLEQTIGWLRDNRAL